VCKAMKVERLCPRAYARPRGLPARFLSGGVFGSSPSLSHRVSKFSRKAWPSMSLVGRMEGEVLAMADSSNWQWQLARHRVIIGVDVLVVEPCQPYFHLRSQALSASASGFGQGPLANTACSGWWVRAAFSSRFLA